MLLAILLLMVAITGGTLLTFLFDRSTPRAARLCMGACIGLALMATAGFLLALLFGLGATTIILTALLLLSPLLLLLNGELRVAILPALRPNPSPATGSAGSIGYLAFYLAIAILLAMVFSRAVFELAGRHLYRRHQ